MAKAPNIRRLLVEDFPGQSDWIDKLLQPINQISVTLSTALNKGLSLRDNSGVGYLELTVDTSNPSTYPIIIKHGMSSIWGLTLVYAFDTGNNPPPIQGLNAVWEDLGDGRLSISRLPGLTEGRTYNLRFLALPR